ncbi:hypothetical protein GCM10027169_23010 [Gordonia jinhuaensis]|uniref:Uncharacterized protein n=1 Tax=Gordonia jinhuaensis TaxID=1517702 RepID=A0A916TEP2_9ACTN|nr:hypothetical protein [Gordonia jinhuaensis]GGB41590.1 hypothetical protein GCM10011489_31460 [Gordonia jinhuaensis]
MRNDECSAMGCAEGASVDDHGKLIALIRRGEDGGIPLRDNGVDLLFCTEHAEHFLRHWAGLLALTDASNQQIYVITGLTLEEHRALLADSIGGLVTRRERRPDTERTQGCGVGSRGTEGDPRSGRGSALDAASTAETIGGSGQRGGKTDG